MPSGRRQKDIFDIISKQFETMPHYEQILKYVAHITKETDYMITSECSFRRAAGLPMISAQITAWRRLGRLP